MRTAHETSAASRTRSSSSLPSHVRLVGLLAGVALLATVACATAATPDTLSRVGDTHSSNATLTAAEIERVPGATSLFEAVRQLRPLFLRPRPTVATLRGQPPVLAVYINDMYAGGADVLQTLSPSVVHSMRYLQRSDAMTFAGSMTPGDGFIMITLKTVSRR
jgi:hypothetical protein